MAQIPVTVIHARRDSDTVGVLWKAGDRPAPARPGRVESEAEAGAYIVIDGGQHP